jgi:hypothetical protein
LEAIILGNKMFIFDWRDGTFSLFEPLLAGRQAVSGAVDHSISFAQNFEIKKDRSR